MNNEQIPGRPHQVSPPVTGAPVLAGDAVVHEPALAPAVPKRSSTLPFIAAVIGSLVLLGGGGFFALTALGDTGGAETPEAVVDGLLEAASNEDFITLAELVEPSERRTLIEPVATDVIPELIRLGVFERSPNPAKVEGLDIEFTDVEYRIEQAPGAPDIIHVYFTSGEITSRFDTAELPFTDAFRDEFGDEFDTPEPNASSLENGSEPMVLVERNGRWYVSGWFTIAENLRPESTPIPTVAETPPALGSPSPEAAVENMIEEMFSLDIAGMIGRTDPEEMAALYRYAPLFLDDAQVWTDEVLAEAEAENVTWNISNLQLDADTSGDDAKVVLRGWTFDFSSPDFNFDIDYSPTVVSGTLLGDGADFTFNLTPQRWVIEGTDRGDPFTVDVRINGNSVVGTAEGRGDSYSFDVQVDPEGQCSTATLVENGESETIDCLEEESFGSLSWFSGAFEQWSKEFPGVPFAARQTDGEWYVSPIGSTFDVYVNSLRRLNDGAFRDADTAGSSIFATTPVSPGYLYWLAYWVGSIGYEDDYYDDVESYVDEEAFSEDVEDDLWDERVEPDTYDSDFELEDADGDGFYEISPGLATEDEFAKIEEALNSESAAAKAIIEAEAAG